MKNLVCVGILVALPGLAQAAGKDQSSPTALGVPCSEIYQRGIDMQENLRATAIRVACGLDVPGSAGAEGVESDALDEGGPFANINVITGGETFPHVTQSESMVWSTPDGQTIVVNYNDSNTASANYSGVSVSVDGGQTFTRLLPAPFATGHGTNFGDPIVVYNNALGKWFAGDLATGCGGQGVGLWTSLDGMSWTVGACAHNGGADDRESMWVDNNAGSPFYGRMYISWNDFGAGQNIFVVRSDDGVTWSAPVRVQSGGFVRNIQLTGSPDDGGTVFIAGMDEGGGGVNNRINYIYRSLDGGVTWTQIQQGPPFAPPGQALCGYFAAVTPIWRHMGWGQPAVGPGGVIHYVYAARGANAGDLGDILYIRSDDNGTTWTAPIVLNSDAATGGNRTQWMPSLSATPEGLLVASWYDRRNTTDNSYEFWLIRSSDNGQSWGADQPVSDVISPQPEQPDPTVQSCYVGDYNYHSAISSNSWVTWTDGRVQVSGHNQQDVFFAAVPQIQTGGTLTGTVTDAGTGTPIAGARVRAVGAVDRSSSTNRDGVYRLTGLPEGSYDVTVTAFGYVQGSATGVPVVDGQTTTQDFALTPGPAHAVSGTVVSSLTGLPVAGAVLRILGTPIPPAIADDNGMYSFPSVPDGTYTLQASPPATARCLGPKSTTIIVDQDLTVDFALDPRVDGAGMSCDDTIAFNWMPGTTQNPLEGDDVSAPFPLPFPFTFYGQTYTTLNVCTNGFGTFLAPNCNFVNECIPSPNLPNGFIAPFWADLYVNQPGAPADSHIYTGLVGDPGTRQYIIEYRNTTFFARDPMANVVTFEMILNEADNSILYQYNRADGDGNGGGTPNAGAAIGTENQSGAIGLGYSCREPVVFVGKAIRFFQTP